MHIKQIALDQLIPYKLNAKKHPQSQIKSIAESIKKFGWKQPIVISSDFEIIAGHGRAEAAKLLELAIVPCVIADDLSPIEIKAFRILDNKIAETGWDNELLVAELELLDFNFEGFEVNFDNLIQPEKVASPAKEDETEYLIVIDCKNETAQRDLYEELETRGFKCKLIM